jgi:hypothetical protein
MGPVRDPGSDGFAVRERATQDLRRLRELAVPALREALRGP